MSNPLNTTNTNNGTPSSKITPKASSRSREKRTIDEEAGGELKLGEFQHSSAITVSESRELLSMVFKHRMEQGKYELPKKEFGVPPPHLSAFPLLSHYPASPTTGISAHER